jgi:hypothetical protein
MYKVCVKRRSTAAADRITIKDAAAILGVSEMTLRRWDKAGKFKARRHPINNYRFYRRDQVERLRKMIETGSVTPPSRDQRPSPDKQTRLPGKREEAVDA